MRDKKLVASIRDAIISAGLKDGMTISFHHHMRNGDYVLNMVMEEVASQGIKDINVNASSLFDVHAPILEHIRNGVVTGISADYIAAGVENSFAIASSTKRVQALFLGAEDLTADLQCKRTKEGREIEYARTRLVVAARAAGVQVYDTPFTDVNDDEGILVDAQLAKALGFSGKASISPRHVEVINAVFSPTQQEVDYAYEVMEAIELAKAQGKGAIALRGKMIDAPIVARAERTIAMAQALGMERGV